MWKSRKAERITEENRRLETGGGYDCLHSEWT